jgi:NAD(P)-dependent dehydrogenase (short-subunit alcohol dehydrogenase family)
MPITIDLAGQVALVTGAARGLGQATALRLAEAGANLVLVDRELTGLEQAAGLARRLGVSATAVVGDVTDPGFADRAVDAAIAAYDRVDVDVNAAGILSTRPVLELADDDWNQVMEINSTGVMRFARAAARAMVRGGRGGRIVNFASTSAHLAHENSAAYCASKAAVLLLTKTMASELGPHGITVNAVSPGWIDTVMIRPWWEANPREAKVLLRRIPERRLGTAGDVADTVLFLCSPLAAYITGTAIPIDGGFTAHYTTALPEDLTP